MNFLDFREQMPGYERYLVRFQGYIDDPVELSMISKAYRMAKEGHRGQYRGDGVTFYFKHCRDVADMISCELGIKHDWRINALAFIHDIREDVKGITHQDIVREFGEEVAYWLDLLTKGEEYKRDKSSYMRRLVQSRCIPAIIVKLTDRVMNLRTLGMVPRPDFQVKQVNETIEQYYALVDLLIELLRESPRWRDYHYVGYHLKMALETQTRSFGYEYGQRITPHP